LIYAHANASADPFDLVIGDGTAAIAQAGRTLALDPNV